MKGSESFKNVISAHLQSVADKDPLFAESYKKPAKNIDDCITYILNTVKASGCNGFADEEIFGMAMHYYDENDIKVGSPAINTRVIVNHEIVPTEEEIAQAKQAAMDKLVAQQMDKLTHKNKKIASRAAKEAAPVNPQSSLFG